jgi:putative hemolysin
VRHADRPGAVLDRWTDEELSETDSLEATLDAEPDEADAYVPVRFEAHITELGVFELWCVSTQRDRRWKLEFSVRDEGDEP